MILVVSCICCSLRLEIEIQFLGVIACLNNMQIVLFSTGHSAPRYGKYIFRYWRYTKRRHFMRS